MRLSLAFAAAALAALVAAPAAAQQDGAWNSPRALELISRAQARRAQALADTGLVDYRADARGYIYFYLDRRDTAERTLVKTDQVALDVLWKAPDRTKQRIIGLRDAKNLPTNIHYHLDHLTVTQNNFGDRIRLGDGDEVADVLHPAAPRSQEFYDFRLADSSAIRLPGAGGAVRVYRVDVRPRDTSRPALVGSVFVDQRGGDIVRMDFTFTPVSYVDRELDYINITLENGLWKGRFWLPNREVAEIRRQLPELGFPLGGIIRKTMRITNYRFNQNIPDWEFGGPRVVMVPEAQAKSFAFEQTIDQEVREQGLGPQVELAEVRRQAAQLVRGRVLSGLPGTRLDVPAASTVGRYNRAEGVVAGFGVRSTPRDRLELSVDGGWAFGAMHPVASASATLIRPGARVTGSGFVFQPRDVGVGPVVSGAMNTLTSALAGRDYTDPYYASGGSVRADAPVGRGWTASATARVEDQRSAEREATVSLGGDFRPVHAVDDGVMLGGALALTRGAASGRASAWTATLGVDGGRLTATDSVDGFTFARPRLDLGYVRRWSPRAAELTVDLSAGAALGDLPRQALYLIGGRGTVPGHDFRAYGGDRFATLRATAAADLWAPFVRGRLLGAAGWADVTDAGRPALAAWGAPDRLSTTRRPITSVGAGVGVLYDIIRFDMARGLGPGGHWELIIEANPSFWDFL